MSPIDFNSCSIFASLMLASANLIKTSLLSYAEFEALLCGLRQFVLCWKACPIVVDAVLPVCAKIGEIRIKIDSLKIGSIKIYHNLILYAIRNRGNFYPIFYCSTYRTMPVHTARFKDSTSFDIFTVNFSSDKFNNSLHSPFASEPNITIIFESIFLYCCMVLF